MASENASTLPDETMSFVLRQTELAKAGLRLGQLTIQGRPTISTPTFIAPTSRGVIPHVTQDVLSKLTRVPAVYIGLEDFIEKTPQKAPVFHLASQASSRLRDFIALPSDCVSILGPRRVPALECPNQNTNSSIAICTSVGFKSLNVDDYVQNAQPLQADITLSIADVVTNKQISQKRVEKSADRTHAWMKDTLTAGAEAEPNASTLFASIPPLEPHQQSFYLSDLCDEYKSEIRGIGLHSAETAANLPQALQDLPRICLTNPESPHDILRAVALGNDMVTVSFVTETSENGIAFSFSLDESGEQSNEPLGFDLWDASHATDISPLVKDCKCYTCTKHHRAYLHHLLSAKEMLAWTLLQIHNFHAIDRFFAEIREAIADGSFEQKSREFSRAYDVEVPKASGQGPRIRGYQMKSVGGGEPRKNRKAYGRLEEQARKLKEAESGVATPEVETLAEDLENQGLGEVQK